MLYISLDLTDMWEHKRDMWVYIIVAPKASIEILMGEREDLMGGDARDVHGMGFNAREDRPTHWCRVDVDHRAHTLHDVMNRPLQEHRRTMWS